ncbi:hypothetical protein U9M48_002728 [Paspalum notatum var. saurae]|uniref:Reverse transcriptase domain-containing protein n=1 Tax=Paspalum notatum var. saurae TaxID=547442 RepID=A0AAQ3PPQ2_PASNO
MPVQGKEEEEEKKTCQDTCTQKGQLNHVTAEDTSNAPDVVLVKLIHPCGQVIEFEPVQSTATHQLHSLVTKTLEEVPVVCEYLDVFPDELPGLPPDRAVEFAINLVPGTAPIAKAPYRMSGKEYDELKRQLDELLEKGVNQMQCITMGSPSVIRKEERRNNEIVH